MAKSRGDFLMDQQTFPLRFLDQEYRLFYIKDPSRAEQALSQFMEKDVLFGFDLETMSYEEFRHDSSAPLDPLRSKPRLIQICDGKNVLVFDTLFGINLGLFRCFLQSKRLLAHNAMFEIQHLIHNFKIDNADIGCTYLATKLLHHALYVDDGGIAAGLEDVVKSLFKINLFKEIDHKFWCRPDLTYEQIEYAALDAVAVLRVGEKLVKGLTKHGLLKVYKLYKDAQWPLAKMQLNGMKIDVEKHRELIGKWKLDAYAAKKELTALTGLQNLTSHTIAEYLEEKLEPSVLAIWPRTDTGKLSTDANAFSEFDWLDIVKPFARFQKATILSSTFGMKLQHKINSVDKRIHCQYKLCGTRTGRLSSVNPNLQQMPHDKETRSIFIPKEGYVLIVADYGQIELRVAAELSQDRQMVHAYREGIDLHQLTAANVSRKRIEDVTDEDRQKAKALNFGLLFGLGASKFKHYAKKQYKVELSTGEAFEAVNSWHKLYEGYSAWQKEQARTCEIDLKVRTITGKLRKLNKDNYYGASANTPVQGSASEVMLRALCLLYKSDIRDYLINTIHDEIVLEVEAEPVVVSVASHILNDAMEAAYESVFPNGLTRKLVKLKVCAHWGEAK